MRSQEYVIKGHRRPGMLEYAGRPWIVETTKAGALVKSVEALVPEKEALAGKEKELMAALNDALTTIGYEVVPLPAAGRWGPG